MTNVLLGIGITLSVIAMVLAATSGLKSGGAARLILAGLAFIVAGIFFLISGGDQTPPTLSFAAGIIAVSGGAIRHINYIRTGA